MLDPLHDAGSIFALSLCVILIPQLRVLFFKKGGAQSDFSTSSPLRISFFDFVRGVAIIAVIIIHSVWVLLLTRGADNLFISDFINMLMRFAVPVFIIVSGILLSIKKSGFVFKDLSDFYLPKIKRIFIPYVVVVGVLSLVNRESFLLFLKNLLTGESSPPFYFIVVLLQLYILYPFFVRFRNSNFFLPISFIISLVSVLMPPLWNIFGVPFFGQFLFFFCYGIARREEVLYRLSQNKKSTPYELFPWLMLFVAYISFFLVSEPAYYYNGHLIYGLVIFNLLIFKWTYAPEIVKKTFSYIGRASLWIFLTHFVSTQFVSLWVSEIFPEFVLYLPIAITLSILVSVLIGIILERGYGRLFSSRVLLKKEL